MNSVALSNPGPAMARTIVEPSASDQLARALARVLAAISEPGDSAGIILNPLPIRRADAAPMEIPNQNLNALLNTVIAQSNLKQLPADLPEQPQVIDATVLGNTLLADQDGQAPAYRVSVQWQNRILQLLSGAQLPVGGRLQLQINARGEVSLLNASPPAPNILPSAFSKPMLALQMALRENLALAQPLQSLLPLLLKLNGADSLSPALGKAIAQLLNSFARPEQLRDVNALKQALRNSGSLFEARLNGADSAAAIASGDIKAQIVQLLALLRKQGFAPPSPDKPPLPGDQDLVYSARPQQSPGHNIKNEAQADSTDELLNQLGKLLGGGLARIQLNQLDGASARHLNSPDNPQPVPTWVFELPLHTPRGADALHVRIEQRQQQREGRARSQWTVNIGFDLHDLGKLAASLTIVERSVSATLWSEREPMHRTVRAEIEHLRAGLEQAGIKVNEVQCRLGLPPQRNTLLSQQLVDVLT